MATEGQTPPENGSSQTGPAETAQQLGAGKGFEPEKKGSNTALWIFLAIVLIGVLLLNPVGCAFLGAFIGIGQIRIIESKLRKPEIYEPVARRLAAYCQSEQTLFPKYPSSAWLPEGVARLGHPYCTIAPNYAHVEMGGGFYHYGYRLQLDETASTQQTNVWQLSLCGEGAKDTHLMTLAMAANYHLVATDLEKLVGSNYDSSIKKGGADAFQGKVLLQLRFGNQAGALRSCEEWIRQEPDSWLPRFMFAHVRCRQGELEVASTDFEDWVQHHKNFAHCIYLALFQLREGRTNEAMKGVRWALEQPFIEPPKTDGNKFFLGQNGALMAYIQGDYDLSLAMCEKMLSSADQEKWWTRKILKLKAAVMFMKNNPSKASALMQEAANLRDSSPFSAESMAKRDDAFRQALERNDSAFMTDFRNCVDEMDSWFSPFETDETGIHGNGLNRASPYPKTWTTDKMIPEQE